MEFFLKSKFRIQNSNPLDEDFSRRRVLNAIYRDWTGSPIALLSSLITINPLSISNTFQFTSTTFTWYKCKYQAGKRIPLNYYEVNQASPPHTAPSPINLAEPPNNGRVILTLSKSRPLSPLLPSLTRDQHHIKEFLFQSFLSNHESLTNYPDLFDFQRGPPPSYDDQHLRSNDRCYLDLW